MFGAIGTALYSNHGHLDVEKLLKFLGFCCFVLNFLGSFTLRLLPGSPTSSVISSTSDLLEETPLLSETPSYSTLQTPSQILYEHAESEYAEEREEISQQVNLGIENEVLSAIGSIAVYDTQSDELDRIELEDIKCFRSIDSYLLGTNMVIIVGVGLMYINNVGAISNLQFTSNFLTSA